MQHELFPRSNLELSLRNGIKEPRLWVRRLVIWEKPEKIVRDISLQPGLNVIWSPDPEPTGDENEDQPIGHGSGKTTFCRLLRYCLGEESFAPEGQRNAIWTHFPEGSVGAEIILDGTKWIVVRSLTNRKKDFAFKDSDFTAAFADDAKATGIAPLRIAITDAIIGDAAKLMPPSIDENEVWEAALAWLTRDQECRFSKILDWRSADSKSNSPVQGRSADDMLAIVRSLIKALTAEELETKDREKEEERKLSQYQTQLSRLEWQCERTRSELSGFFGSDQTAGSDLDAAGLKEAAQKNYAKTLDLPDDINITDLEEARVKRNEARQEFDTVQAALRDTEITIEEKRKAIGYVRAELPEASAEYNRENKPVCPICRVPIDKVKAEGCSISAITCDLNALQARIKKLEETISREEEEINRLEETKKPELQQKMALAKQRLEPLENAVSKLEAVLLDHSQEQKNASRIVDSANRYESLISEKSQMQQQVDSAAENLTTIRETLVEHRKNVAEVIRSLSSRFDTILKELIHAPVKGEAKLDGNGLALKVELGGDRSTAAIESLKVVAFDLAVLTLSMEGRTCLPAFLLHDSPREADLGNSIYKRLFELPHKLEKLSDTASFQYIITTTTAPPEQFKNEEWLKLTIKGSPASERLLKTDL